MKKAALDREYELWRKRIGRRLKKLASPEIALRDAFAPFTWHTYQEALADLRRAALILLQSPDDGEDKGLLERHRAGQAACDALWLIEIMFYRGDMISEIDAVYQTVWHLLECAFNVPSTDTDRDIERGRAILRATQRGHESVHGTWKEKTTRWNEYQEYCDTLRGNGMSKMKIYENAAQHFNVDMRTIRNHVVLK